MRVLKLSVMLLVAAVAGCNGKQGPALTPKSEADKRTLNRLNERIGKLHFANAGLKDVVQFFRDVSALNLYVNWRALEGAGLERNTPVKLHLQDVRFHEALTKCLGALKSDPPITYALADGVVLISTAEDATELARQINAGLAAGKAEAEKPALKWGNERISEIDFDDIDLRDIRRFLCDEPARPGIYIQWKRPRSVGITTHMPVNLHLRDVTLHTVLVLCLVEACGTGKAGYSLAGGTLLISTAEDAARRARLIGTPPPAGKTEADRRVLTRLNETIRELSFDDIELQDIIQFFRDAGGLSIHVEWNTLNSVGVTKHTPVKADLREVPVYAALSLCLADAAGAGTLSYIIKDGKVHISTSEGLKELRKTAGQPKP